MKNIKADTIRLMVKRGTTRSELEEYFDCHYLTIRKTIINTFTEKTLYKIMKMLNINLKKQNEVNEILGIESPERELVIVADDTYLLKFGTKWIESQKSSVFVPRICVDEIQKRASTSPAAKNIFDFLWNSSRVTFFKLEKNLLFENPSFEVTKKMIAVAATCC